MGDMESVDAIVPLIIGGSGFSHQFETNPEITPISSILRAAFDAGITSIDTSPYYDPSEQLIGAALNQPEITSAYSRDQYHIFTKVGRITATHLDYSPGWIRKSVARSLARFQTTYLDIVFAHDVELVAIPEAVTAVGTLFELASKGCICQVGISGYDIDVLSTVARLCKERFGRSIDAIQTWAQLTLQNTKLEKRGFAKFRAEGVKRVFCSSPLACGLLRTESVPIGRLGDWHPAPQDLRLRAQEAAVFVAKHDDDLASLALRYAVRRAQHHSSTEMFVSTICGINSLSQLANNIKTVRTAMAHSNGGNSGSRVCLGGDIDDKEQRLYAEVMRILGPWIDYDFSTKLMAGAQDPVTTQSQDFNTEAVPARL